MNRSPHRWFGEGRQPCCLMFAIDDVAHILLTRHLIPVESSVGYLRIPYRMVCDYDISLAAYHDRHSSLVRTDDYWFLEEQVQNY